MRRVVALVLAAVLVTACGDGGDKAASTSAPQLTLPPPSTQQVGAGADGTASTAPAATDVAPPDAIGRLAASFTGQLLVRQSKNEGSGRSPAATWRVRRAASSCSPAAGRAPAGSSRAT